MKKEVFLERLEALLQDIPEEEKRDAIDYYRDYLEEAGPEKEEEVLADSVYLYDGNQILLVADENGVYYNEDDFNN